MGLAWRRRPPNRLLWISWDHDEFWRSWQRKVVMIDGHSPQTTDKSRYSRSYRRPTSSVSHHRGRLSRIVGRETGRAAARRRLRARSAARRTHIQAPRGHQAKPATAGDALRAGPACPERQRGRPEARQAPGPGRTPGALGRADRAQLDRAGTGAGVAACPRDNSTPTSAASSSEVGAPRTTRMNGEGSTVPQHTAPDRHGRPVAWQANLRSRTARRGRSERPCTCPP
jgi:hypothetical protein